MRGAELQLEPLDLPFEMEAEDSCASDQTDAASALKREVAERLAAHRSRRGRQTASPSNLVSIPQPIPQPTPARPRKANRIAAAVAERYAQSPSYRDFLAAEAARALEEANARADIAARNAQAVAAAQRQLLAELDLWTEPAPGAWDRTTPEPGAPGLDSETGESVPRLSGSGVNSGSGVKSGSSGSSATPALPLPPPPTRHAIQHAPSDLRVRLYEDAGITASHSHAAMRVNQPRPSDDPISAEEILALDDEIAFRRAPRFPPPATPPVPIPANLLEFPRQLVAPRKARPRVAEGPLREDADTATEAAQLRIFEVEPSQIATQPAPAAAAAEPPVWSSIHLDAHPDTRAALPGDLQTDAQPLPEPTPQPDLAAALPLATASLGQRAMAAIVDACILGFTLLGIAAGFARSVAVLPPAPVAAIAAAATLLVLFILYQMLFFTFSCATPGMRYARIGLCTFADENPTRAEMRRRTWALLLSACPLGLGFLWALLDEDRLGWHDRISRMYQRGY